MATAMRAAKGTLLYKGGTGTPKTGGTLIEEVAEIECPNQEAADIEATSHDSTAEEFINGIMANGTVTATVHYTGATGQAALNTALGGAAAQYYINLPGATSPQLDFMGLCKSRQWLTPLKGGLDAKYTIKVTGALSVTAQS